MAYATTLRDDLCEPRFRVAWWQDGRAAHHAMGCGLEDRRLSQRRSSGETVHASWLCQYDGACDDSSFGRVRHEQI
jgi:hypothetical protein